MTEVGAAPNAIELSCSKIVYRAMARKDWIDFNANRVLPGAFLRRPNDDDGLSVDIASPQSCANALSKCHGVASLHVGRIRDIGLDVEVDDPPHASIKKLPRPSDDAAEAEHKASQLAKQARLIPLIPPRTS